MGEAECKKTRRGGMEASAKKEGGRNAMSAKKGGGIMAVSAKNEEGRGAERAYKTEGMGAASAVKRGWKRGSKCRTREGGGKLGKLNYELQHIVIAMGRWINKLNPI